MNHYNDTNALLSSNDELTHLIEAVGIRTWSNLLDWTQKLPYGRNENRRDLKLVISEEKGTCSSKHAMLKKVADLNQIANVNLILGIYKMSEKNTPKIGDELTENSLEYIPEAHCYLEIDGERKDFTSPASNFETIKDDVMKEISIEPEQVTDFKVTYHQSFLKQWIEDEKIPFSFEDIWRIREQCIENISEMN